MIAKIHRPDSAASMTPATDNGHSGTRNPADASKKATAYIHRLLCDMIWLFPDLYKTQAEHIHRQ